jgi:hypothetical protein
VKNSFIILFSLFIIQKAAARRVAINNTGEAPDIFYKKISCEDYHSPQLISFYL